MKLEIIWPKGRKPLYHQYPGQCQPQPAFIELDCRARTLRADWNSEIGTAVPFDVWHGITIRFPIRNDLTNKETRAALKRIKKSCELICDGFEVVWDGSNNVGRFTNVARDLLETIHHYCEIELDVDMFIEKGK